MRITRFINKPEELKPNECFVFGSNLSGVNGAGAAALAKELGARNIAYGPSFRTSQFEGRLVLNVFTFAIPTKNWTISRRLTVAQIKVFVDLFIEFTKSHPNTTFLVTEIGCGLAGYHPDEIAPLFKKAVKQENIHLPERFWEILNGY